LSSGFADEVSEMIVMVITLGARRRLGANMNGDSA